MRSRMLAACLLLPALGVGVAACGGGSSSTSTSGGGSTQAAKTNCTASVGVMAPITGQVAQLGGEQLHFAQLAVEQDNAKNGTKITIVQGDTQLDPKQATTVGRQFTSNDKIVAVVGPAGSQEVSAVGSQFSRAGLPFISGSATNTDLTNGDFPTFLRVVARDDVQGPQDANYIANTLKPKKAMLVDDQTSYSTGLADAIIPVLKKARLTASR
jgi:branched-chain amino acid transport system substrate-binding protein